MASRTIYEMLVRELKIELEERDLPTSGLKIELVNRLREALIAEGKDPETQKIETEMRPVEVIEWIRKRDPQAMKSIGCSDDKLTEPPGTLVTHEEPPETLVTGDEPPETLVNCEDTPETLVTHEEPPKTLMNRYEPPWEQRRKVERSEETSRVHRSRGERSRTEMNLAIDFNLVSSVYIHPSSVKRKTFRYCYNVCFVIVMLFCNNKSLILLGLIDGGQYLKRLHLRENHCLIILCRINGTFGIPEAKCCKEIRWLNVCSGENEHMQNTQLVMWTDLNIHTRTNLNVIIFYLTQDLYCHTESISGCVFPYNVKTVIRLMGSKFSNPPSTLQNITSADYLFGTSRLKRGAVL